MKKLIALLMALTVLLSMAACAKNQADPTNSTPAADTQNTENTENTENNGEAATPAKQLTEQFRTLVQTETDVEVLAQTLITDESIPFMGSSVPVEPGFLNGFTDEITGFVKGAQFGPNIGSIPYIGYVFELENAEGAEAFMEMLKSKANLRWNVCTQADEMVAEAQGNLVLFAMCPLTFEE